MVNAKIKPHFLPYTSCVLFSGVFGDVHVIPFRLKIVPETFFNARLDIYSWLTPKDPKPRQLQMKTKQNRIFAVCPKLTAFGHIFTEFACFEQGNGFLNLSGFL